MLKGGQFMEPMYSTRNKIVRYKLEEDTVLLKRSGLTHQQIADELNMSGKIPNNDLVTRDDVDRFMKRVPAVQKALVKESKARLVEVVNTNFDIIHELSSLFSRTKNLLDAMEEKAEQSGKLVGAMSFKAISSEMREMLRHMTDIQKEINDYENIRKFMEIVLQVLQEECPAQIPKIAERLRIMKGTQWFANIIGKC
jgi:hypothetical protein